MKIDFNLNAHVYVQLTPFGYKMHEQNHIDLYTRAGYKEIPEYRNFFRTDEEGWTEFQMWDLMQQFGKYLHMGMREVPFKLNIKIKVDEKT